MKLCNDHDGSPGALITEGPGEITDLLISAKQKFYSDARLVESNQFDPRSNWIIQIRNYLLMDSQLYVRDSKSTVLRLKQNSGLIHIKLSNIEYNLFLKAMTKQSKAWQK